MNVVKTNTIDHMLIFTNTGKMYRLLVDDIPDGTNASKGVSIKSLVPAISASEKISLVTSLERYGEDRSLIFATKQGNIKKTSLKEYKDFKRKTGIIAIKLREGDSVAAIDLGTAEDIILVTKKGMSIRFNLSSVPFGSRATMGVKGIKIDEDDEVVSLNVIKDTVNYIGVAYEDGLGKKN